MLNILSDTVKTIRNAFILNYNNNNKQITHSNKNWR